MTWYKGYIKTQRKIIVNNYLLNDQVNNDIVIEADIITEAVIGHIGLYCVLQLVLHAKQ
jgi:hypothetical protein